MIKRMNKRMWLGEESCIFFDGEFYSQGTELSQVLHLLWCLFNKEA
jgi:hypothetical protein